MLYSIKNIPYAILQKLLKKLIAKERARQVKLGYTYEHDEHIYLEHNVNHLVEQARIHYVRAHFIEVLALLDADITVRKNNQPRYDN